MEFLSDTKGGEYSSKPTYPPGKWFYYEQVLKVLNYAIFEPDRGVLEVYQLDNSGQYQLQAPDENNRHWIAEINLFLGVWQDIRANRTGYWLRWWDEHGELLLWGSELVAQERQRAEKAEQATRDAIPRLLQMGLNVEQVAQALGIPVEEVIAIAYPFLLSVILHLHSAPAI